MNTQIRRRFKKVTDGSLSVWMDHISAMMFECASWSCFVGALYGNHIATMDGFKLVVTCGRAFQRCGLAPRSTGHRLSSGNCSVLQHARRSDNAETLHLTNHDLALREAEEQEKCRKTAAGRLGCPRYIPPHPLRCSSSPRLPHQ